MEKLMLLVAFLAYFNEQALEALAGQFKPKIGGLMVYIAAAVGLAECVLMRVNALPILGLEINVYFGYIVTGLAVGGLSNVLHKFVGEPSRSP